MFDVQWVLMIQVGWLFPFSTEAVFLAALILGGN